MEKKIEFLDREHTSKLKGAAIMLVLISHLAVYLFLDILGKGGIARLATPLGGIGASLFLFVSGYGIAQSAKGGLSGFWKKRFFGVMLPYLLVWLALIPTSISSYTDIWDIAFDLLTISPRAEYFWYIGYQIFWYIVFYFTARLGVPRWARLAIIFGIGTLCFFVLPNIYAEKAFSFAIGVLLLDNFCRKGLSVVYRYKNLFTSVFLGADKEQKSLVFLSALLNYRVICYATEQD